MSVLNKLAPANLQTQVQMARVMTSLSADVGRAYAQWMATLAVHPAFVMRHSLSLTGDYLGIGGELLRQAAGVDAGEGEAASNGARGPADRRFGGEHWERRPLFNAMRRAWQATARTTLSMADGAPGLDEDTARKLKFFTSQFLDALAPSNFALSNPEVLAATKTSKGRNLMEGMRNFWSDLDLKHGRLKISMSDLGAFKVGRDLAVTPGKVIYQNELMQLIQYTPSTAKVARRPLLILPPWLNKYYVLDMQPSNSMVRWLVDQGHTVFLVSWVNPNGETRDKTFDDYLLEGPLAALDVIKDVTGQEEVNAMGYCLGGILLGVLLAWLDAKGRHPIRSATFLTTLVDYSDVGDIKAFVTEELVDRLEAVGRARGLHPGRQRLLGLPHAAGAGPDLVVHHQPLPAGQAARALRPAVLERGRDQHAGGLPRLVHAQHVPAQLAARAERAGGRGRVHRRHAHQDAVLHPFHARRPHRAVEDLLRDDPAVRRPEAIRARQLRPHRRRHQPADPGQVRLPREQRRARRRRRLVRADRRAPGELVAGLGQVAEASLRRPGEGARGGQARGLSRHRGRAGIVRAPHARRDALNGPTRDARLLSPRFVGAARRSGRRSGFSRDRPRLSRLKPLLHAATRARPAGLSTCAGRRSPRRSSRS
jgi:hypothetical protein